MKAKIGITEGRLSGAPRVPHQTEHVVDIQSLEYEFAINTSCHGLGNIAMSTNRVWKCAWILVVSIYCFGFINMHVFTCIFQHFYNNSYLFIVFNSL